MTFTAGGSESAARLFLRLIILSIVNARAVSHEVARLSSESKSHEKTKGRILQVTPTNDLLFRGAAHRRLCSRIDAEGNRTRPVLFNFNCRRRPHSRQGRADRGPAADDQPLSQQTADLQRR